MKNRADAGRAADPNGQKADKIAVRLGRPVGVALNEYVLPSGLKHFVKPWTVAEPSGGEQGPGPP